MKRCTLLFVSILSIVGCSSGNDSLPENDNVAIETATDSLILESSIDSGVDNGVDINSPISETDTETNDLSSEELTTDAPDPLVQNTTDVSFEVTVPVYQSNELQLRLNWGEFSTALSWVGDELWSTDVTLPTSTEQLLSIVFFDENGGIELGSFEQQYKTGINAAEVFQVAADQFDSDRWDSDGDSINNLDELIAGTDPRVDEDSLLSIVDNQKMSLVFIANYFESLMPSERPYMGTEEDIVHEMYVGTVTTTDIDINGNGSILVDTLPFNKRGRREAERLLLEDSVQWSGSWNFSDDFGLSQDFTSTVSVNGGVHRLVEEGSGSWIGTYSHLWNTSVDVTGQLVEGTSYCKVASGTIVESYGNNYNGRSETTLTISRESIDDLWRVSGVHNTDGVMSSSEYFARELSMHMIRFGYQHLVSENDYFYCDYAEL